MYKHIGPLFENGSPRKPVLVVSLHYYIDRDCQWILFSDFLKSLLLEYFITNM